MPLTMQAAVTWEPWKVNSSRRVEDQDLKHHWTDGEVTIFFPRCSLSWSRRKFKSWHQCKWENFRRSTPVQVQGIGRGSSGCNNGSSRGTTDVSTCGEENLSPIKELWSPRRWEQIPVAFFSLCPLTAWPQTSAGRTWKVVKLYTSC